MRDVTLEDTVRHAFSTRAFATGVPTALVGTPALSVLEENNATPITAGVSVSVDRASVVGLNEATVLATAANGYEVGKNYAIYISTGTVGGVSVVGEVVGQFQIETSAAAVDLANGTDGLGAIKAGVDDVPTVAEFNARTLPTASYFDPAADAVANVTLVATVTTLTGHTAQTADHTAPIADLPTVAEFNARTLLAADYFDPAVDPVANVTLVATVTTVTGGALDATVAKDATGAKEATLTARTLPTASYFDPAADAVANVTLVATTTVNTDMRGTDGVDTATMRGTDGAASPAQVNAEVLDVLTVDTFAEPGQITPLAATTLATKLAFIYKAFRNLMNNNGTTIQLFNDAGTVVDQKAAVSETAGTVTRGKFGVGP